MDILQRKKFFYLLKDIATLLGFTLATGILAARLTLILGVAWLNQLIPLLYGGIIFLLIMIIDYYWRYFRPIHRRRICINQRKYRVKAVRIASDLFIIYVKEMQQYYLFFRQEEYRLKSDKDIMFIRVAKHWLPFTVQMQYKQTKHPLRSYGISWLPPAAYQLLLQEPVLRVIRPFVSVESDFIRIGQRRVILKKWEKYRHASHLQLLVIFTSVALLLNFFYNYLPQVSEVVIIKYLILSIIYIFILPAIVIHQLNKRKLLRSFHVNKGKNHVVLYQRLGQHLLFIKHKHHIDSSLLYKIPVTITLPTINYLKLELDKQPIFLLPAKQFHTREQSLYGEQQILNVEFKLEPSQSIKLEQAKEIVISHTRAYESYTQEIVNIKDWYRRKLYIERLDSFH